MLEQFLQQYKLLSPVTRHTLTGGEPTVYPELTELYKLFGRHGHTLHIVTNGQLEQNRKLTIEHRAVVRSATISFDAGEREANDLVRGAGTFEKAVDAVREYNRAGIAATPFFVLHDQNLHTIPAALELAKSLSINKVLFTTLHPTGKGAELIASVDKLRVAIADGYKLAAKLGINMTCNTKTIDPYICRAWRCDTLDDPDVSELTLLPTGDISLCCDLYDVDYAYERLVGEGHVKPNHAKFNALLGNIKQEPLSLILRRRELRVNALKAQREVDHAEGKLTGTRQYMCENCKFYHCHPTQEQVINFVK